MTIEDSDFRSLEESELTRPRDADGQLPKMALLHLVEESDLIDRGIDAGLPFEGAAPDLGAFEFQVEATGR